MSVGLRIANDLTLSMSMAVSAKVLQCRMDLRNVVEKVAAYSKGGVPADLERDICIYARALWLRLVDATAWYDQLDQDMVQLCRDDLIKALGALAPESKYYRSVQQKLAFVERVAEGVAVDEVLRQAIAEHETESP